MDEAAKPVGGGRRKSWVRSIPTGLAALALGFGLVMQTQLAHDRGLDALSQPELVDLLGQVNGRSDRLSDEIQRLESVKRGLTGGTRDQAAADQARSRVEALGILAGTTKAHGPGITLRIEGGNDAPRASQVLNLVSELRDAGAEAVQINDVRVVAGTWFDEKDGKVVVDGKPLAMPLEVRAIGDAHTLAQSMRIPGGAEQSLSEGGRTVKIEQQADVLVDALHTPQERRYARPVGSTTQSP